MKVHKDRSRHATITDDKVLGFFGTYRFLSNFHYCKVEYKGMTFKSSEHAYMAAKSTDLSVRELIRDCVTPGDARKMGQTIKLRDDWEQVKVMVMAKILASKFKLNKYIQECLLMTGDKYLEESNNWGDRFWGVHYEFDESGNVLHSEGKNQLGRILMIVRKAIR